MPSENQGQITGKDAKVFMLPWHTKTGLNVRLLSNNKNFLLHTKRSSVFIFNSEKSTFDCLTLENARVRMETVIFNYFSFQVFSNSIYLILYYFNASSKTTIKVSNKTILFFLLKRTNPNTMEICLMGLKDFFGGITLCYKFGLIFSIRSS